MEFRKALKSDIESIMTIIKQAQEYLRQKGIDQWQNNYPNTEVIMNDINNGYGYVLLKDGNIVGTAAVSFDGEKTYEKIYDGNWLTNYKYAVIHRMAVANELKGLGLGSIIIEHIEKMCLEKGIHSIRIDTHKDNISMQRLIEKNRFQYCGVIYLQDKSKRLAFEKIIK